MSESEQRAWYQDGSTVIASVVVTVFIGAFIFTKYLEVQESKKPYAIPLISGILRQPLLENHSLEIKLWHQFPGTLRNGTLTVTATSEMVIGSPINKYHSFENWEPNEDNGVTFFIPLRDFDPSQELPLRIRLEAKNAKTHEHSSVWLGSNWKSNQDKE